MDLDFEIDLAKAEKTEDGKYLISGIASTTDVDLQNDAMSLDAIKSMAAQAVGLPIVRSHDHEGLDEFGTVIKSEVRNNGTQLYIQAELEPDDSEAMRAYNKISKGKKFGYSVGGKITDSKPSFGKANRILNGIKLAHFMLTSKPVNTSTLVFALKKSLSEDNMETNDVEKAGAMFSATNLASLKIIHDSTTDVAVKSGIRSMLGSVADAVLGVSDATVGDSPADDSNPAGVADESFSPMIADAIAKSQKEIKDEMTLAIVEALNEVKKNTPAVEVRDDTPATIEELNALYSNFFNV
jgi:phage head maturation protease